MTEFAKQDRSLAQRVLDRVKTLIADIRNIYNKLIAQGSDEIAALRDELKTLEKIRDLFFEALDETAPAVNQEQKNTAVKLSTKLNTDYITAVENGDTETAQKLVDEAAKAAGYTYKLYHQTENDFTVFDTNRKGAGTGDYETPFGIFMKPTNSNIGLKGQKQIPLYAKIENPLVASNRENLMYELRDAASVTAVQEEIKKTNNEYKERVEQAGKDLQSYLIEYRKAHPDEPRSEIYNDKGFNEIYNREDSLIEEWTATIDELAVKSKNAITEHLKSNGYDGVIIEEDIGSFGRKTETYIALDNTQVKSADPVTYDNNGNIIPLSERFNDRKVDIRWSKKNVASKSKKRYNKSSYKEFDSLAMRWRNKAITKVGDLTVISRGFDDFSLIEATEDGYVELARGIYDEVRSEYERAYTETIDEIYGNYESYGADEGSDIWDMQLPEIRTDGNRNLEDISGRGLQTDSSRSDEHSRLGDKEKSLIPSAKPTNPIREEVSDYINNRSDMQAIYKTIDKRYRIAGKTRLNEKSIESFANKILSQTHSKYSKELLTERLTALFEFMANRVCQFSMQIKFSSASF